MKKLPFTKDAYHAILAEKLTPLPLGQTAVTTQPNPILQKLVQRARQRRQGL